MPFRVSPFWHPEDAFLMKLRVSSLLFTCLTLSGFASQRPLLPENSLGPLTIQEKNDFNRKDFEYSRISYVASIDKGKVLTFTGSSVGGSLVWAKQGANWLGGCRLSPVIKAGPMKGDRKYSYF